MTTQKTLTAAQCILFAAENRADLPECKTLEEAAMVFGKAFGVTTEDIRRTKRLTFGRYCSLTGRKIGSPQVRRLSLGRIFALADQPVVA